MRALISDCGKYRYWLEMGYGPRIVTWIMLNPSRAGTIEFGEIVSDPTAGRVEGFSRAWGFDMALVVNLFAWRATVPQDLPADQATAKGPDNWKHVHDSVKRAQLVVCAWGAMPFAQRAGREMVGNLLELGIRPACLGVNAGGSPKHPLYLAADTALRAYP